MDYPFKCQNDQLQWYSRPVFSPQWNTLLGREVSFTNHPTDNDIIFREDNEEQVFGSINNDAFFLPTTEDNTHRFPRTDMVVNYQQLLGVWPLVDYSPLPSTFSPGVPEWTQLPELPLAEDTFNSHHNLAESPYMPDYAPRDDDSNDMADANSSSEYESTDPYDYGSPSSLNLSETSSDFPAVYDLSHQDTGPNYPNLLPLSNDVDPPTYATDPDRLYDYSSPCISAWSIMLSNTALGAFKSGSESISKYPTSSYPMHYPASPYDDTINAAPWNASLPNNIDPLSSAYGSHSSGVLERLSFDEGNPTCGWSKAQVSNFWHTDQNADANSIVPIENQHTKSNTNPQQTWDESAWAVNSFCEEGIDPFTIISDHDTGAGPSTGSSVATSMLDIERARQGQRVLAADILAAAEKQKGKGKRKAVETPEPPPALKKLCTEAGVSEASESQKKKGKGKAVEVSELASASTKIRAESPAQLMGNITSADSDENPAFYLPGFKQHPTSQFVHMFSGETASSSGNPPSISGQASALTTFKLEKDGGMTPRGVTFINEVDGWKKKLI